MHTGQMEVFKKNGEVKTTRVSRVSKAFTAKFGEHKGEKVCFGDIDDRKPRVCCVCCQEQHFDAKGYPNEKYFGKGDEAICLSCKEEEEMGY